MDEAVEFASMEQIVWPIYLQTDLLIEIIAAIFSILMIDNRYAFEAWPTSRTLRSDTYLPLVPPICAS